MRYTLEIQKLLLQTQNDSLHPREKANLLKEAIRIADENEDVEWATELRLDLIYELNLLSADAEEITVFSKILDDYENHKDVIKEDDLLWKYKWIWACTFDLPEIPMEQVKAIGNGEQSNLLYKRWIENCQETVDKLSNGQIGYVHVRGMNSESFREVYSALLGRCRNKKAVIVDTRHNGGGWLHDDLATLLSGKEYQRFEPRGQYIGSDPYNKWTKPSCVLMCEDNYSNAHGFPWVYKTLGIGKLIGAPVPGTMTAVWWETQIDPTLVFGIPQVGVKDMQGNYLENQQLQPDVEVYNTPEAQLSGEDTQLKRAVEVMLQTVK